VEGIAVEEGILAVEHNLAEVLNNGGHRNVVAIVLLIPYFTG